MINNRSIVDDSNLQKSSQSEQFSTPESKGGKEGITDRVARAIREGKQQLDNDASESHDCIIQLSQEAQTQLKTVAQALNLNYPNVIDSAIHYVYFSIQIQKKCLNEIIVERPERNEEGEGLYPHKVTLFGDTNRKLKKMGLKDRASDCAIAGIRLLYENNCLVTSNHPSSKT